ncbi:MAG: FGGY-family carbohydrate kinase [Anaerolineales bacterium]|jgi:xylulokinase|nr:FGGY-family carbohydrate kinase [Anaerolineales bacterium]|tara:strand:+ start:3612 stop:5063 length:1452 start_codon:yes stop_codon:yes gene_type:complete
MSSSTLLLGIDVGTTRTKVGAFHLDGHLAAAAASDYPLQFNANGAAEQDPLDWWGATREAIGAVLSQVAAAEIIGVSVGGQGPTMVALDGALSPVGPALTWMDRRAATEVGELNVRIGHSLPAHAFVPKVMWLHRHRPEVYASSRWFCQAWDYVAAQLCGLLSASMSPAIAPWDEDTLAASELDREKFPPQRLMGERIGSVTPAAAAATGLPEGIPVVGGISDYYESVIGVDALRPSIACDTGGTSQSLNLCWDAALQVQGAFCLPSFVEGHWYIGGPASTTGKAFEWWRDQVLESGSDSATLLEAAASVSPGSESLLFLPYLSGERTPLWDPQARAVFFGLSLHHTRAHMTRAVVESVAYVLCHIIERIETAGGGVHEIHCCGGQAKSDLWSQIKADATGKRVIVPEVSDAAMLGAAIIAGVGVGAFGDFIIGAAQMVRPRKFLEPDEANHERYRSIFSVYRDLYPALRPFYKRTGELVDLL